MYLSHSLNGHTVSAEFLSEDKSKTAVFYDKRRLDKVPEDYVCGLKLYKSDLFIIYQRAVLRVRGITEGCFVPEDDYTVSMQDYYSYEYPQLFDFKGERLFAHIGGRLFELDEKTDKWQEKARFFIGEDKVEVCADGICVFGANLQQDEDWNIKKTYKIEP
jgi:hypothetical protein